MTKNEAKEKIKGLVAQYERLKPAHIKRYNEATTRKDFIMPLFQALGWDVYNHFGSDEVIEEESVVEGTVDYSFRLNNIPQFLLEAKALKVDLDKKQWAEQAESYAWNMGIDWVILTDFEGLKLFNAEWKKDTPHPNLEFSYKEYLSRFDDLWLFSKEGFQKGLLDKKTEKWGIKARRMEVTEKLAKDLMKWREALFSNFQKWNEDKSEAEIDEAVQRILDRFIFIRSCEDRKIEPITLWPAFKKWEKSKTHYNFIKALRPIFKEFNEKYNSNLFREHLCEKLDTEGAAFIDVINDLYGDKESGVKYNFAAIKPDILGAVYEQYLGHLLEKVKKNQIAEEKAKRKKQGIYYTPTFIVDYIVENTLGKLIKEKSLTEIENLKVLDPACGSGSFLIEVFDVLDKKLKEERNSRTSSDHAYRKYRILTGNIYGVDLDEQAIEFTRLNLLLKALEPKHKLPLLSENTKVGNSLISGTEKELKKYFGRDWKKKKSFNWKEEFSNIFRGKNPGFDVIIGNPPYVSVKRGIPKEENNYYVNNFLNAKGQYDLFLLFIERSFNLLKNGGYFSFIIPKQILTNINFKTCRKFIFDNSNMIKVADAAMPFSEANVETIILICKKGIPKAKEIMIDKIYENAEVESLKEIKINQTEKQSQDLFINIESKNMPDELLNKVYRNSLFINDLFNIIRGLEFGKKDKKISTTKALDELTIGRGEDLSRYKYNFGDHFIKINNVNKKEILRKEKILVRRVANKIIATIDKSGFPNLNAIYNLIPKKSKYSIEYILALLNSRLLNHIFKQTNPIEDKLFPYIRVFQLGKVPIYKIDFSNKGEKIKYNKLIKLARKMLRLNKELQKTTEKSDKWYKIKKEIEKKDKIIDEKVYELYELTKEEIKIVES